jgi:segregation and condensation protein B
MTENNNTQDEWRIIEAVLFQSSEPLHENHLRTYLENPANLKNILSRMQTFYQHRGIHLRRAGKLWSFITAPDLKKQIQKITNTKNLQKKESQALTEILAIIAYHQPITRAEVASIRGAETNSTILSRMVSYGWIKTLGRKDTLGKPMLWGTTDTFLHHFGFESLNDLPSVDELQKNGFMPPEPENQLIFDDKPEEQKE